LDTTVDTATPEFTPTVFEVPSTINPFPTASPTITLTPTSTFHSSIISKVHNVIFTEYDDPQSATWVLYFETEDTANYSQLKELSVSIQIDRTEYLILGSDVITQIDRYGGLLIDYDERDFQKSDVLNISLSIHNQSDESFYSMSSSIPNYSYTGVIDIPISDEYLSENGPLVVYHVDDMAPGDVLLSSFSEVTREREWGDPYVIPGISQNHGNAIDIGVLNLTDKTIYPVIFKGSYPLELLFVYTHSTECSEIDYQLEFDLPFFALVESGDETTKYPLHLRMNHLTSLDESMVIGRTIFPGESIGRTGNGINACAGEVHIGVYGVQPGQTDIGGIHYDNPPDNPNALRLPFSIFISESLKRYIVDEFLR